MSKTVGLVPGKPGDKKGKDAERVLKELKKENEKLIAENKKLPEGLTAQGIEITSTGYMLDATEKNARYQVQCRLIYYEGGNTNG